MVAVIGEAVISRQVGGKQDRNGGLCKQEIRSGFEETSNLRTVQEMPNGYPNLEGFVPDLCPISDREMLESICTQDVYDEIEDFRVERIDVAIRGTPEEWLVQALTYLSERPGEAVMSCLETFDSWENVNDSDVKEAKKMLGGVMFRHKELGEMSQGEWDDLVDEVLMLAEAEEKADLY